MANKISVIIDATTDKAITSLKNFRTSIAEADGAAGKMKAGFGAAAGFVQANAAALAATAGTALVTFGVKAVAVFQETALAAGKFSDATGVGVEDASRWIEVAGDVGVSGDAIQGAMAKMAKSIAIGGVEFDKLGLTVVRFADGSVDASSTFVNALSKIESIKDPSAKALAATKLFGRGYAEIAELTGMSADQLRAKLAGVGDAQVIDKSELEKARKFREAIDNLGDSLNAISIDAGEELVPVLTALADAIGKLDAIAGDIPGVEGFADGVGKVLTLVTNAINPVKSATGAWHSFGKVFEDGNSVAERGMGLFDGLLNLVPVFGSTLADLTPNFEDNTKATSDLNDKTKDLEWSLRDEAASAKVAAENVRNLRQPIVDAEQATADLETAYTNLTNKWSDKSAYLDVLDALDQFKWKMAEGKLSTREQEQATLDLQGKYGDLIQKMDEVPLEVKTSLLAQVDRANFDVVQSTIDYLTRDRFVKINGVIQGTADAIERSQQKPPPGRASGGLVTSGTTYLVGEKGPELLTMGAQSGVITPNSALGGGGGGGINLTVNAGMGADGAAIGQQVVQMIKAYELRNGTGWRR